MNLTDEERRVLDVFSDDNEVYPLRDMASEAGVKLKDLRLILKNLMRVGLVQFGTCYSLDNMSKRCGSGYWISQAGRTVRGF